jgi:hypothetical protein
MGSHPVTILFLDMKGRTNPWMLQGFQRNNPNVFFRRPREGGNEQ